MRKSSVLRWAVWFFLAVLFAAACVLLSKWQFERREEAVTKLQRVAANYDREPEVIDPSWFSDKEIATKEWLPVKVQGEYLAKDQLLVRNRPIAGQPGYLQLVPFRISTGEILIVERGWIPADSNLQPSKEFSVAGQKIELTGRIRLSEQTPNRTSPAGQVTSIRLSDLSNLTGLNLEQAFYLRLISESPPENEYPQSLGKPVLDEGNHLSYAIQWILFALMGFFALFWAIKQEREYQRIEKDPNLRKPKRKSIDESEEDEILDRIS
ncbi:MAG: SURF1 family protein [Actinomycetota bacterium]